ncbi:hypothetical protein FGO68_gene2443 [Halteria grandinella]|uniref:Uncharacterized protein n=1 Tax=Halteria grandinella TaxID=5974 RepID=A0A8J8NY15_HALGN|nr:hypothetical protein FGO68_gene2443 [Halteria grandinella]
MTNLCDYVLCIMDDQCQSGYCYQSENVCMQRPSEEQPNLTCTNNQYLTKKEGESYIAFGIQSNKCNGQPCSCNDECKSGYCDYLQSACMELEKPWDGELKCNASAQMCDMDTILQNHEETTNRCNGVGCLCNTWCASGYCNQETLKCDSANSSAKCNQSDFMYCSTDYIWEPIPTGNRCLNTQCSCDIQCQSGICDRVSGYCSNTSSQFPQSLCNMTTTTYFCFDNFTVKSIYQNENRCEDVTCFCDSQCKSGYCYNQKCNSSEAIRLSCNKSINSYQCQDGDIRSMSSNNRCNGINCYCNSQCESGYCYHGNFVNDAKCLIRNEINQNCNNTATECTLTDGLNSKIFSLLNRCINVSCMYSWECQQGYCNKTTKQCMDPPANSSAIELCNASSTLEYNFNGEIQVIPDTINRCEGVDCLCDNQCIVGTYCNAKTLQCLKGNRSNLECNETNYLCTIDQIGGSFRQTTQTLKRCQGIQCDCNDQCQSNHCDPDFGQCIPNNLSKESNCNSTSKFCREESINRCDHTYCQCDNQCQSGYCDQFCRQNDGVSCDSRFEVCRFENGSKIIVDGINKCYGAKCRCDSECNSGFCLVPDNASSGLCAIEPIKCNLTSNQRCKRDGKQSEYLKNLCDGVKCLWDGDCKSRICIDDGVCGSTKVVQFCNKTDKFTLSRNYSTGLLDQIDSTIRCENATCQFDLQCKSGLCQNGICSLCNLYPLHSQALCPGQTCENNEQCSTNICYNETCASLNDCNQTLLPQTPTINRCLNVTCSLSTDCQPFSTCIDTICTLKTIQQSQGLSSSTLVIILAIAFSSLVGAFLLFFLVRYLYHLKHKLVTNKVRKNNINLTTENSIVQQKGNNHEELVSSADQSAFQEFNKLDNSSTQIEKKAIDPTRILQL